MFIIDLHAKKEKLIPQTSYTNTSFLLLHAPMLEAKQSQASSWEEKTEPTPDIWHLLHGVQSGGKSALFPKRFVFSLKMAGESKD